MEFCNKLHQTLLFTNLDLAIFASMVQIEESLNDKRSRSSNKHSRMHFGGIRKPKQHVKTAAGRTLTIAGEWNGV